MILSMQRVHIHVTRSFPSLDLPRFHLGNTIVLRATKGIQTETINAYNRSARIINRLHRLSYTRIITIVASKVYGNLEIRTGKKLIFHTSGFPPMPSCPPSSFVPPLAAPSFSSPRRLVAFLAEPRLLPSRRHLADDSGSLQPPCVS